MYISENDKKDKIKGKNLYLKLSSDPHIYAVACVHGHTHVYTRKREKHRTLVPSKGVALTPASADCLPR